MVHDVIVIAAASFVFVGTVLRMWDSLADADRSGEFAPRTSREELHRLRLFFTMLDRRAHAATEDRQLYYLRVAQGWFLLSIGAFLGLVLATAVALGD
ncbi:MAG: hypothetical protein ACRDO2_05055 [Nocardioidaceae bacterium]